MSKGTHNERERVFSGRSSPNKNFHMNHSGQNFNTNPPQNNISSLQNLNGNGNVISPKTSVLGNYGKSMHIAKDKFNLKSLVQNRLSKSQNGFNISNRFDSKIPDCY